MLQCVAVSVCVCTTSEDGGKFQRHRKAIIAGLEALFVHPYQHFIAQILARGPCCDAVSCSELQ